jgi:hypothetical protein
MSTRDLEPLVSDRASDSVRVSACGAGGWDIIVEVKGRPVRREHCNDWHRVERRRAFLRARFGSGAAAESADRLTR